VFALHVLDVRTHPLVGTCGGLDLIGDPVLIAVPYFVRQWAENLQLVAMGDGDHIVDAWSAVWLTRLGSQP
jgi:hypothetical protein